MKFTMTIKNANFAANTTTGIISGQTFPAKEWIKENFPSIKWDSENKNWTMDPDMMTKRIVEMNSYFVRVAKMEATVTEIKETTTVHHHDTICSRCHTYCNGDCTSSK